MFKKLISSSRFLCSQLIPNLCVLCGQNAYPLSRLCLGCRDDLPILTQGCQICAQFLSASNNYLCGSCLREKPSYNKIFALFPYTFPISSLIKRLKFHHELTIANLFADLLSERVRNDWYRDLPLPDYIIPIPLHKTRMIQRGFNQALEIAKPSARLLKIPLAHRFTFRTKATTAQSGLTAQKRYLNVVNAFSVKTEFSGSQVAVIDDVVTTGNTVNSFCAELRKHGAINISVWCIARRG